MEQLERVEMDYTKLDLIFVDDKSLLPLKHTILTIAVDRYTGCICGYYVGYDPPSYYHLLRNQGITV
jgi:putative transposase